MLEQHQIELNKQQSPQGIPLEQCIGPYGDYKGLEVLGIHFTFNEGTKENDYDHHWVMRLEFFTSFLAGKRERIEKYRKYSAEKNIGSIRVEGIADSKKIMDEYLANR